MSSLTPRQLAGAYNFSMSDAVPLSQADLTRPFVYERARGLFYAPWGVHQIAMSLLLAMQHNMECGIDVAGKLQLDYPVGTADYWLEHTPGAAFKSSVSSQIKVGSGRGLTPLERRLFGDFEAIFPGNPERDFR